MPKKTGKCEDGHDQVTWYADAAVPCWYCHPEHPFWAPKRLLVR